MVPLVEWMSQMGKILIHLHSMFQMDVSFACCGIRVANDHDGWLYSKFKLETLLVIVSSVIGDLWGLEALSLAMIVGGSGIAHKCSR